jgi:hypothetical protein
VIFWGGVLAIARRHLLTPVDRRSAITQGLSFQAGGGWKIIAVVATTIPIEFAVREEDVLGYRLLLRALLLLTIQLYDGPLPWHRRLPAVHAGWVAPILRPELLV